LQVRLVLTPSLDIPRIRAISIDLDDTLWPIWPTITRAESVLLDWLTHHAPATAALFSDTEALRAIRNQMVTLRPDLKGDLSALRRESIRLALTQAGDEPALAALRTALAPRLAEAQMRDLAALLSLAPVRGVGDLPRAAQEMRLARGAPDGLRAAAGR